MMNINYGFWTDADVGTLTGSTNYLALSLCGDCGQSPLQGTLCRWGLQDEGCEWI